MARNILTVRLRALVADDIMQLVPAADGSVYQDYVLTQKGRDLLPVLVALRQWGIKCFPDGEPWGNELVERATGLPIRRLQLQAEDGRPVTPEAIELRIVPTP